MSSTLVSAAYCLLPGCGWTAGPSDVDDPTGTRDVETRARRHLGEITGSPTTNGHPVTVTSWVSAGRDADRAAVRGWTEQVEQTLVRWTPPPATPPQQSSEPTSAEPSTPAAAAPRP